jgi:hypothetical protein
MSPSDEGIKYWMQPSRRCAFLGGSQSNHPRWSLICKPRRFNVELFGSGLAVIISGSLLLLISIFY